MHFDANKNVTLGSSTGDSLLPRWLDLCSHVDGETEIESLDFEDGSEIPAEVFAFPAVSDFDVMESHVLL